MSVSKRLTEGFSAKEKGGGLSRSRKTRALEGEKVTSSGGVRILWSCGYELATRQEKFRQEYSVVYDTARRGGGGRGGRRRLQKKEDCKSRNGEPQ